MSYISFDGTDDVFDSRDILERIDELVSEFEESFEYDEAGINVRTLDIGRMSVDDWAVGLTQADAKELAELIEFRNAEDGMHEDSFEGGITFIHDRYFVEAMEEFCRELEIVPASMDELVEIDWEATAENLREDYTEVTFRGGIYWAR